MRRYGFHGLSYEYIAATLPDVAPEIAPGRVVVAHLGNGASMCALEGGRSIDSTMSFTALDGLIIGTHRGALDPGVVLHLMRAHGMDADAIEQLLYHQCGLAGVSGMSNDMQDLETSDDPRVAQAIALFVYRVNRELSALAGALEGLDGLVFTAGIGEHAREIRARVCRHAAMPPCRLARHRARPGGQPGRWAADLERGEQGVGLGRADQRGAHDREAHAGTPAPQPRRHRGDMSPGEGPGHSWWFESDGGFLSIGEEWRACPSSCPQLRRRSGGRRPGAAHGRHPWTAAAAGAARRTWAPGRPA
jgi:Acetokinase family